MVTLPTYTVEVAWTGNLTGVFRVGVSTVGGTDVLGNPFNGVSFDDITDHVYGFKSSRGRSDDLTEVEQGTLTINLRDQDGRFNPENALSDLYGYLVPLRPVRVRATHLGVTYSLFQGYIERIEYDPLSRTSVIEVVDFFEILNSGVTASTTVSTTAGGLIERVLDDLEFTDPSMRNIDAGRPISHQGVSGRTAITELGDAIVVDRGLFFATKDGGVRYISGANYWKRSTATATLDGDTSSEMRIATDKQRIVNRITTRSSIPSSASHDCTNSVSAGKYGVRVTSGIDPVADLTATEAIALGTWVVSIYGDPTVPARAIVLKPDSDATVVKMLGLEIGDRVAFSEPRGNTNAEGIIEGINHTAEVGTLHQTQFLVSKRNHEAFTVGISTLDGVDLIYY